MITLALLIAHSRSKNTRFQPEVLYLGTFILDLCLIDALVSIFGGC